MEGGFEMVIGFFGGSWEGKVLLFGEHTTWRANCELLIDGCVWFASIHSH